MAKGTFRWSDVGIRTAFFLLLFLPISLQQILGVPKFCGSHAVLDDSRYCFSSDGDKRTWSDADAQCRQYGGNLATVETVREYHFIVEHFPPSWMTSWIGANEITLTDWQWVSGSRISDRFKNYGSMRDGYRYCLAIEENQGFRWTNYDCKKEHNYICSTDRTEDRCKGQRFVYVGSVCYFVSDQRSSWFSARSDCVYGKRGDLLIVDTFELQAKLVGILKNIFNVWGPQTYWIGGTKSRWLWTNGEDVRLYLWGDFSPYRSDWNCMAVTSGSHGGYFYIDYDCRKEQQFICEFDAEMHSPLAISPARPDSPDLPSLTASPVTQTVSTAPQPATVSATVLGGGMSFGEIAGLVIGLLALLVLMLFMIYFLWKRCCDTCTIFKKESDYGGSRLNNEIEDIETISSVGSIYSNVVVLNLRDITPNIPPRPEKRAKEPKQFCRPNKESPLAALADVIRKNMTRLKQDKGDRRKNRHDPQPPPVVLTNARGNLPRLNISVAYASPDVSQKTRRAHENEAFNYVDENGIHIQDGSDHYESGGSSRRTVSPVQLNSETYAIVEHPRNSPNQHHLYFSSDNSSHSHPDATKQLVTNLNPPHPGSDQENLGKDVEDALYSLDHNIRQHGTVRQRDAPNGTHHRLFDVNGLDEGEMDAGSGARDDTTTPLNEVTVEPLFSTIKDLFLTADGDEFLSLKRSPKRTREHSDENMEPVKVDANIDGSLGDRQSPSELGSGTQNCTQDDTRACGVEVIGINAFNDINENQAKQDEIGYQPDKTVGLRRTGIDTHSSASGLRNTTENSRKQSKTTDVLNEPNNKNQPSASVSALPHSPQSETSHSRPTSPMSKDNAALSEMSPKSDTASQRFSTLHRPQKPPVPAKPAHLLGGSG